MVTQKSMVPQLSFPRTFHSKSDVTNWEALGTSWKEEKVRENKMNASRVKDKDFAKSSKPVWHCPLGCGKSLQKTSSRSIHKHRRECFRTFIRLWQGSKSSSTDELHENYFLAKNRGLNSLIQFCFVGTEQGKMLTFFRAPNCEAPRKNIIEYCKRILTICFPSKTINLVSNGQGIQYYHQSAWVNGRVLVFIVGVSSEYQGPSISHILNSFKEAYEAEEVQAIQQLSPRRVSKDLRCKFQFSSNRTMNLLPEREAIITNPKKIFRESYEAGRVRAAQHLLPKRSLKSENIDEASSKSSHISKQGGGKSLSHHKISNFIKHRSIRAGTYKFERDAKREFLIPAGILLQLASHGNEKASYENQVLKLNSGSAYGADVPALSPRILKRRFTRTETACETCHRMKVRCKMGANGQRFPCAGCEKRGLQDSCTAYCSVKRQRRRKPLQSLNSKLCVTSLRPRNILN
mmetsp:Transcript_19504/g.30967  ORF Transcript_19504/g.30967 Transcript_19504/m.30967 type:complete len:462 (-) Transcript_19504:213-1598(-)